MSDNPIKKLGTHDLNDALGLVLKTFLEFETPHYSCEGLREFKRYIQQGPMEKRLQGGGLVFWGYVSDGEIVGVIAIKPAGHIALLFVDSAHQRQGIGRKLFETAQQHLSHHGCQEITVHASLFAVDVYRRLGFRATDAQQEENGIRFVPMKKVVALKKP
ncbi:MAG: GNAT family N-acetyltransferase [Turicibacter sp.]|nr:GNAT family N-acetyltransferase [Turicibacter sp.]